MKTLILGATGFIGKALAKKFSTESEFDYLISSGRNQRSAGRNCIVGDLRDEETHSEILNRKYKRIIDASWLGLPNLEPEFNSKNYQIKARTIQTCVEMNLEQYIGFGSCLEYGSLTGKVSEQDVGVDVQDFGQTKLSILRLLEESQIKFCWFRPFYLVGAGQHDNSLIKTAIRNYKSGKNFLPKEPNKSFDFITIDEATEAFKMVLDKPLQSSVYNIGSGEAVSAMEVVNVVRKNFGLHPIASEKNEALLADTSKLTSSTQWRRTTSIYESLKQIVEEIRAT